MIVSSMRYRTWEKTMRLSSYFFLATTVLSPFLAVLLTLFDTDFDVPFVKKKLSTLSKSAKAPSSLKQGTTHSLPMTNHLHYVPSPDIAKHLQFVSYNDRPDQGEPKDRFINIASSDNSILTKLNEVIFFKCLESNKILFTNEITPYSITPVIVQDDSLWLNFDVVYKNKENKTIYHASESIPLVKSAVTSDKEFQSVSGTLGSAKFFTSDKLISLMGGTEFSRSKDLSRIYFSSNSIDPMISVKEQDQFSYENGNWIKNSKETKGKPLFLVDSVQTNQVTGTLWSFDGFNKTKITIPLHKEVSSKVQSFTFDTVYKRNNESVICKLDGRTYILKPNDWLVKKHKTWNQVETLQEFNDIIDFKNLNEVIIFDHIEKSGDGEDFIGYIFDETRSNFKKLKIPLKKNATSRYSK